MGSLLTIHRQTLMMASRIVKSPAVQTTAKRQFAAQAAVAKSERELVKAEPLKVSTLKSGLNVASIENHSPVTTLGVVVKAGSRNETYDNAGVSHALRIAAGLGTKNNSAFGICRNLQQAGASMVCTQGREHTLYTVQATRDQTDVAIEYLADVVSNQSFKPWELSRSVPRMKLEPLPLELQDLELGLDQCSDLLSLDTPGTLHSSSSFSHTLFWDSPCPRPWVCSV